MPNEILNRPIYNSILGRATSGLGGEGGGGDGSILESFYQNVPIIPTTQQLRSATREITFSEVEYPLNLSCPISLERFEANTVVTEILHCRHLFNPASLQLWFAGNVCCPMCRYDIRNYSTIPSEATTTETTMSPATTTNVNIARESIPTTTSSNVDLLASFTENLLSQLFNNPTTLLGTNPINYNFDPSSNSITFVTEYAYPPSR